MIPSSLRRVSWRGQVVRVKVTITSMRDFFVVKMLDPSEYLEHDILRFPFAESVRCLGVVYDVAEQITTRAKLQENMPSKHLVKRRRQS